MPPLVSIVIPCFNAAPWLTESVESALAQTWAPVEVIIVDDGSRDNSLAVARSFSSRGVRVLSQPNAGAASARNRGLAAASGEYIQFLDADDVLDCHKISSQVRRLAGESATAIASGRWGRFVQSPADAEFPEEPNYRDLGGLEFLQIQFEAGCMMHPAAWLVPRRVIDRAGPWDERLSLNDDGEFFCRVALAADRIAFCDDARVYYRSSVAGSLSRRVDRPALESLYRTSEQITAHMLAHDTSARTKRAVANAWKRSAFDLYPGAPDLSRAADVASARFGPHSQRLIARPRVRLASKLLGWRLAKRLLG